MDSNDTREEYHPDLAERLMSRREVSVDEVIERYPGVVTLIHDLALGMPAGERRENLQSMGVDVGRHIGRKNRALKRAATIREALIVGVAPELQAFGRGSVNGNTIRFNWSEFSKLYQLSSTAQESNGQLQCDFLAGLIQGLLSRNSRVAVPEVTETCCRGSGAAHCEFKVLEPSKANGHVGTCASSGNVLKRLLGR